MTAEELLQFTHTLGISRDQILREEMEMEFLNQLAAHKLGARVIFYGGTALRLAYGSPRFSEDIDLLLTKPIPFRVFATFMKDVIKKHPLWMIGDIKEKRNTLFSLIVISDEKLKHHFSVKIEIHKSSQPLDVSTHLALLKSPVSIAEPLLLVPLLSELKQLKEEALAERQKARDLFDLWYIAQSMRVPFSPPRNKGVYTRRGFKNELRVFLPRTFYPVIDQLYDSITKKN